MLAWNRLTFIMLATLQGGMAENRSALLRRDGLSAAKEVLYELDKYLSNRLHSFAVPTVDVAMHDLIEEFIFQEPPGSPSTGKVCFQHFCNF